MAKKALKTSTKEPVIPIPEEVSIAEVAAKEEAAKLEAEENLGKNRLSKGQIAALLAEKAERKKRGEARAATRPKSKPGSLVNRGR